MEACKTPNYCWRKQSCITRDVEKKTVIVCKSWHTSPDSHQVVKPIPTQCRWCTSIKAFSEAARDSSTDLRVAVDSSWFSSFVGIFHWKKSSFDGVRSSLLSLKFGNFDVISNKLYISHLSLQSILKNLTIMDLKISLYLHHATRHILGSFGSKEGTATCMVTDWQGGYLFLICVDLHQFPILWLHIDQIDHTILQCSRTRKGMFYQYIGAIYFCTAFWRWKLTPCMRVKRKETYRNANHAKKWDACQKWHPIRTLSTKQRC